MPVLDLDHCQKAYTNHLTEVNESRKVIASEDIYNAQGILLVKKGNSLDEKAAKKIVQFKLQKPLEENVAIENTIDGRQLFEHMMSRIRDSEEYSLIHQRLNLEDDLKELCLIYGSYSTLVQKVTVLSVQIPKVYEGGLFAAYTGLALARQMHLSRESITAIFLAGLVHDIGMLHIDPEIVKKKEKYSPEEWRSMQAHAVIGEKVLSGVAKLSPIVSRAVLEHHERTDGSGYPKGLVGANLSLEGQIVAMSDTLFAIMTNRLIKSGRAYKEVIPIIQMNSTVHFYHVYEAFIRVMRRADVPDQRAIADADIPAMIARLLEESKQLEMLYKSSAQLVARLPRGTRMKRLNVAINMVDHIYKVMSGSGVLHEEYQRWLEHVKAESLVDSYIEVERAELILGEYRWQFLQLSRALHLVLEEHPNLDPTVKNVVKTWLAEFESEID